MTPTAQKARAKRELRTLLAYALAPAAPALSLHVIIEALRDRSIPRYDGLITAIAALWVSYAAFLLFGAPLIYFLKRFGLYTLPMITLSAGLTGVAVLRLFLLALGAMLGSQPASPLSWMEVAWGLGLGASVGISFALIAGAPLRTNRS